MTVNRVDRIDSRVKVKRVLVSVSDKTYLDILVKGLMDVNPEVVFYSTGGTYQYIAGILGDRAKDALVQVSDYTGQPETQGGLVKTLDFKIYLGLLTETYNESHRLDLERTQAVPLDMTVVNLYPFKETVAKAGITAEDARANIDIGGPCMIRASAKNFIRVAPVVDPEDYASLVEEMRKNEGQTTLAQRYRLAAKAFAHTAAYDTAIAAYLGNLEFSTDVNPCYRSV
ncbi:phosphoribosylaminoimidazolecarboxamide formyltransferase/IMP cyclohydrolase [Desulfobotulus alkaliphilus]|uniref:Phosphoribosylaminoimidazolecarboxamide formyltransferase/IMP cyclohydrolase n=1 Tax=Desulfobotulus alkaliphilus TaxID=622671 RepID=A0A562RG98_9BACT|nr:hypothetical protein [Desulfobotulus alkaliphilus]TWI68087.1 phosphoribosylaminoimidazolecarboxamide formyltransferase/IMP cyclohydrolase [Desulfobotulus alkaliphilus]